MLEDLTYAKDKAEESDRLKTAFINNMSHEIRTPLNGILGFLQLMKEEELTEKEWEEYFTIINKSGDRLMKTINDLVEISQIQSGQMKTRITQTNIGLITDQVYQYFQADASIKGLDFKVNKSEDSECIIDSDGDKLKSILSILVENAVKFTYTGSIEFGYKYIDNTAIEFYVKDTGIGIPIDKHHVIFERFMQVDVSNTRHFEGCGLGLSIAKAYVEMLHGTIRVESEPDKGSVFYFTVPCNSSNISKQPSINEEVVKNDESKQLDLKILVVDDDVSSGRLLSVMVKRYGTEIINVATGKEAVSICRNMPDIDLVLMDIKMPDMDGYEATRLIRQFNTSVVIIAQTAYALSGESEKAREAGCNDYISKPIGKNELIRLINKFLFT
jgi:CheY-like chemotaxis protein